MSKLVFAFLLVILIAFCLKNLWDSLKPKRKKRKKVIEKSKYLDLDIFNNDIDYAISPAKTKWLIQNYLNDKFDPKYNDSLSFYLLTLLGKHQYSNITKNYIDSLVLKTQIDTKVVLTAEVFLNYRLARCFKNGKPTFYIFSEYVDCVDAEEYTLLYKYLVNIINSGTLPDGWNFYHICSFVHFLYTSRFSGNFNRSPLDFVDRLYLCNLFIHFSTLVRKDKHCKYFYFANYINTNLGDYSHFLRLCTRYQKHQYGLRHRKASDSKIRHLAAFEEDIGFYISKKCIYKRRIPVCLKGHRESIDNIATLCKDRYIALTDIIYSMHDNIAEAEVVGICLKDELKDMLDCFKGCRYEYIRVYDNGHFSELVSYGYSYNHI